MTSAEEHQQDAITDDVQPSLADITAAALGNPRGAIAGYHDSKFARKSVSKFRKEILGAHRFVLTPELIQLVTNVSLSLNADSFAVMLENARPCFDSMWLEWDEQARRESLIERHEKMLGQVPDAPPSDFVDRVGYLIGKWDVRKSHESGIVIDAFPTAAQFTSVSYLARGKVTVAPLGYFLSNGSSLQTRTNLAGFMKNLIPGKEVQLAGEYLNAAGNKSFRKLFSQLHRNPTTKNIEFQYPEPVDSSTGGGVFLDEVQIFGALLNPGWLENCTDVSDAESLYDSFAKFWSCQTQAIDWMLPPERRLHHHSPGLALPRGSGRFYSPVRGSGRLPTREDASRWDKGTLTNSLSLISDDLRFIVTALAMLNFNWVTRGPAVRSSRSTVIHGRNTPRNEYRRLRVGIPPKDIGKRLASVLSSRERSRQHDVRGHYRCMKNGKRVWIQAHVRGDPALGIITKEYVLDKEAQA